MFRNKRQGWPLSFLFVRKGCQVERENVRCSRKSGGARGNLDRCPSSAPLRTRQTKSSPSMTRRHTLQKGTSYSHLGVFSEAASLLRGMSPILCSLCFGRRGVVENEGPECSRALCPVPSKSGTYLTSRPDYMDTLVSLRRTWGLSLLFRTDGRKIY